jgi:hypothetical protein
MCVCVYYAMRLTYTLCLPLFLLQSSEGYDPSKSSVGGDRMSAWIAQPITGNLSEVPGIGPAGIKKLADKDVTTTFNLIGEFLKLKGEGVESVEHCDRCAAIATTTTDIADNMSPVLAFVLPCTDI